VMLWRSGILLDALSLSGAAAPIGLGFWIGTVMVLNLWLVLWPHQKKVLGFVPAPHEERVRCSRVTFLSARINTMLSIPLLFLMVAGAHGLLLE
ncbi:MAG: urate hydroxylase PuuD, partial [Rhodospirillaceae bacterium]|nr:urate hydroxylase PuuD [Rhodospirillaceae bacterium]